MYDERCGELAEYFLGSGADGVELADLAQMLQDCVEDFMEFRRLARKADQEQNGTRS